MQARDPVAGVGNVQTQGARMGLPLVQPQGAAGQVQRLQGLVGAVGRGPAWTSRAEGMQGLRPMNSGRAGRSSACASSSSESPCPAASRSTTRVS